MNLNDNHEIRTSNLNLKVCEFFINNNKVVLHFKNGKREDDIFLEDLLDKVKLAYGHI